MFFYKYQSKKESSKNLENHPIIDMKTCPEIQANISKTKLQSRVYFIRHQPGADFLLLFLLVFTVILASCSLSYSLIAFSASPRLSKGSQVFSSGSYNRQSNYALIFLYLFNLHIHRKKLRTSQFLHLTRYSVKPDLFTLLSRILSTSYSSSLIFKYRI